MAATPSDFRFVVKGQRGAAFRALRVDAAPSIAWLTEPLPAFGERLGAVLFRIPEQLPRNDTELAGLLAAWPRDLPLVTEFQHASWHVDETFEPLRAAGAVLCTTDLDDLDEPPPIRRTGPFLYLRLRRTALHGRRPRRVGRPARPIPRRRAGRLRRAPPRRGRYERARGRALRPARGTGARPLKVDAGASASGARVLRGSEDDEKLQLGGDVVEAMGHAGRNVERVAGPDVTRLVSGGEPGATGHHDVDLVLGVGLLTIRSAGGQHVQADGQIGDP